MSIQPTVWLADYESVKRKLLETTKERDARDVAIGVLAEDTARTRKYVMTLRNGYDDLNRTIGKVSCGHPSDALTQLIQSWDDFAANPLARAAVEGKR